MTNEERDLITAFIARVAGVAPQPPGGMASPWGSPSVPTTQAPPLPPIDPEADALLAALFQRYPEARYRLAQLAFVQEHALAAAQGRIHQLEAQLRQAATAQPHGGFFSGLFGGGRAAPAAGPAAPPGYPPGYPQAAPGGYPAAAAPAGMFPRSGSGFLGSALTTAAGVAGGLVVGNALMNMLSPHEAGFGTGSDAAWGTQADPTDQSGWAAPDPASAQDPSADPGGWAPDPAADNDPGDGGWDQGGGDWDQGGGSDDTLV